MAQRPAFLSLICILLALVGILFLILGVMLVAFANADFLAEFDLDQYFNSLVGIGMLSLGAAFIILCVLTLLVSYLLWNGKSIGWYLVMVYLVIVAIVGIFALPVGILNLLITVLLIWYFFRPNVREFFGV